MFVIVNLTSFNISIGSYLFKPGVPKYAEEAWVKANWEVIESLETAGKLYKYEAGDEEDTFGRVEYEFTAASPRSVDGALVIHHRRDRFPIVQVCQTVEVGGKDYNLVLPDEGGAGGYTGDTTMDIVHPSTDVVHVYTDATDGVIVLLF